MKLMMEIFRIGNNRFGRMSDGVWWELDEYLMLDEKVEGDGAEDLEKLYQEQWSRDKK